MKIIQSADCGNSPKIQRAEEFVIALARSDLKAIEMKVVEEVCWRRVGEEEFNGRAMLLGELVKQEENTMIQINHTLTHGKVGAVSGKIHTAKNQLLEFCHVLEFSSAKADQIKTITSFLIHVNQEF